MAAEQSGAEAVPDSPPEAQSAQPAGAAGSAGDAPPSDQADFDELKRKFREALDRQHATHGKAEGAQDTGKVHGSHGPPVSRRSFRRKSGG